MPAFLWSIGTVAFAAAVPVHEVPHHSIQRIPNRVNRPIIDGVLDDPAWQFATPLTGWTQVIPRAGALPSEQTDAYLLYDRASLFIGVRCHDRDPENIRATIQKRDERLDSDDHLSLTISPQMDGITGYGFQIGAAGGRLDASISDNGRPSIAANFEWSARTRIDAEGWVAEIEIPFTEFNYIPGQTRWGFNIQRYLAKEGETIRWASPVAAAKVAMPSYAGVLEGLEDIGGGSQVDVKPFVVGEYLRSGHDDDFDSDAGLDLFYKITPKHKLSLSVNTDFAETQVDDRLVNLTRFPLFFPERRDFFVEDSGVFEFGPPPTDPTKIDVIPLFTRRIGLDPTGAEVPLTVAGKFTGTEERFRYGVLYARTESKGSLDRRNLFAGRASMRFFDQSDAGVLFTEGDPLDRGRDATAGVDLNLRTQSFLGDKNLDWSSLVLQSFADGSDSDSSSVRTSLDYPNDTVELGATYALIGEEFDPALGFVPRRGVRKYRSVMAWRPRSEGEIVRQWDFRIEPQLITSGHNSTESVNTLIRPLGVEFETGDLVFFDLIPSREVLDEPFAIHPRVTIPPGSNTFLRYGPRFESSNRRPIAVALASTLGGFYDGNRQDHAVMVDWRPGRHGSVSTDYEVSRVHVAGETFYVRISRLRTNLQFSPELTWTNFAQWDNLSELLSLNSRLRFALRDGQEANLVLNKGWDYDGVLRPGDSKLTLKVSYTFWF